MFSHQSGQQPQRSQPGAGRERQMPCVLRPHVECRPRRFCAARRVPAQSRSEQTAATRLFALAILQRAANHSLRVVCARFLSLAPAGARCAGQSTLIRHCPSLTSTQMALESEGLPLSPARGRGPTMAARSSPQCPGTPWLQRPHLTAAACSAPQCPRCARECRWVGVPCFL